MEDKVAKKLKKQNHTGKSGEKSSSQAETDQILRVDTTNRVTHTTVITGRLLKKKSVC